MSISRENSKTVLKFAKIYIHNQSASKLIAYTIKNVNNKHVYTEEAVVIQFIICFFFFFFK